MRSVFPALGLGLLLLAPSVKAQDWTTILKADGDFALLANYIAAFPDEGSDDPAGWGIEAEYSVSESWFVRGEHVSLEDGDYEERGQEWALGLRLPLPHHLEVHVAALSTRAETNDGFEQDDSRGLGAEMGIAHDFGSFEGFAETALFKDSGEYTAQVSVGLAIPLSDATSIAIEYAYTENDDAELKIGVGITF